MENEENNQSSNKETSKEFNFSVSKDDFKKIGSFFKKYSYLFLLLIPIIISIFIRVQPYGLSATDQWAEDSINDYYRGQITQQINQQYPQLPDSNKQALIEERYQNILVEQKDLIEQQKREASENYKNMLRHPDGTTYLLDLDSYYYMRYAQNILENGFSGTYMLTQENAEAQLVSRPELDLSEPIPWDGERLAPIGSPVEEELHQHLIAIIHRVLSVFGEKNIMYSQFFITPLIMALAAIPAFFIGRRFSGDIGGLFSAILIVTHVGILSRTLTTDTDSYTILFPLLISMFIIYAFTKTEKDSKKKPFIYAALAGLSVGLYAFAWNTWWFIFDLIFASTLVYLLYNGIKYLYSRHKTDLVSLKDKFLYSLTFFFSSLIFVTLMKSFSEFVIGLRGPFLGVSIKDVGTSLWPNIRTTVAELNSQSLSSVINSIGFGGLGINISGFIILFIGLVGFLLTMRPKKEDLPKEYYKTIWLGVLYFLIVSLLLPKISSNIIFITLIAIPYIVLGLYSIHKKWDIDLLPVIILFSWFVGGLFTATKGVRFSILVISPIIIGVGIGFVLLSNLIGKSLSKMIDIDKKVISIVLLIFFGIIVSLPIFPAYSQATQIRPMMNDQWFNTLNKIDNQASEDAIINSWWDFGHWFITLGNRAATFDGAGQDKYMAYWVGRSLYTNDPKHSAGILRMVDCGNNNAFWVLDSYLGDTIQSIEILNKIVVMNNQDAKDYLMQFITEEQAEQVMKYTHCNPPEDYYIASGDMVGKSGVWAHFGKWNFDRANLVYLARENKQEEAVNFMVDKLSYTRKDAEQEYVTIKARGTGNEANTWITDWPSYYSNLQRCDGITEDNVVVCSGSALTFNFDTEEVLIPTSQGEFVPKRFSYLDQNGEFKIIENDDSGDKQILVNQQNGQELGFALIQRDGIYYTLVMHPDLVGSTFTRLYFFRQSECFDIFSTETQFDLSGDILTYKVDWSCLN